MSESFTIARPYAKAAFSFANEKNKIDDWRNLLAFLSELSTNEKVMKLFSSEEKPEKTAHHLANLCGDLIDSFGKNFLYLLAKNKRLTVFPEIFQLFIKFYDEQFKIKNVEVFSAEPLKPKQLDQIKSAMEKRLSAKIHLLSKIDETIISGFIIRVDDFVIDKSIKGRLERFYSFLQS